MTTMPATIAAQQRWRALVTRPRADAGPLVATLATRGIDAVVEPLIEIRYRVDAAVDMAGVQAVLCTSANGARALARASRARHVPMLAVGDATAARARAEGFTLVESAGGTVADLALLASARLRPEGGRLIHVAGSEVAGDLAGALHADGFDVHRLVLYEARPVAALSGPAVDALREGMIDFALFYSPRTAAIFARLAGDPGIAPKLGAVTALTISPAADAALAALPWYDRRIAAAPNQAALLAALDAALVERRPPRAAMTESAR